VVIYGGADFERQILPAPLRSSRFSARSAPFSAPLTLRSHALIVNQSIVEQIRKSAH